ncbi:MAG: M1 family metallopeptidase [Christensenellaceae bacterium]|nr:M1 family metallopeptidase [Christensenellaceae bacterium]
MRKYIFAVLVIAFLVTISLAGCKPENLTPEFISQVDKYKISLEISSDLKKVNIFENVEVFNDSQDQWDVLVFNVYANAYREHATEKAYFTALARYGGLDLDSIKIDDYDYLTTSAVDSLDTILEIKLKEPLAPNNKVLISMQGTLLIPSCNLRLGLSSGEYLNLGNFYPVLSVYENSNWRRDRYTRIGDPFYADIADYEVSVKCNEDLSVAISGDRKTESIDGGEKIITSYGQNLRDFAIVASYQLDKLTGLVGTTEINYYHSSAKDAENCLISAISALETFNSIIGNYPYKVLNLVETDFYYGGMEYSNLVYINRHSKNKKDVIVHETAHQWFACLVGSDSINSGWLDEGLVTYLTDYYYLKTEGEDVYIKRRQSEKSILDTYLKMQIEADSSFDQSIERSLYKFKNNHDYCMIMYNKAGILFETLSHYVGYKKFESVLKTYYDKNCFKIANLESIYKAFQSNHKNIKALTESYIADTMLTFVG